jgi:hypothetical protein
MLRPLAIAALLLSLAGLAPARDIFVDNLGGDDRLTGNASDSTVAGTGPVRTIAKALRLAEKGDRVVLANRGEPYRECVTLHGGGNSGYPGKPFTIIGNGAVLDGSAPIDPLAWEHVEGEIFRYEPRLKSHQQLFRDDRPLVRVPVAGPQMPAMEPLQWCLYNRAIHFRVEAFRAPFDYELSHAEMTVGLTLYEVRHVRIENLTVQGYQLDGLNAHDSAFAVELAGITARGNGRSGISIGGASRVTLVGCLVGNNGAAQVRTEGWSHTKIVDCALLETGAPPLVREGGEVTIVGE